MNPGDKARLEQLLAAMSETGIESLRQRSLDEVGVLFLFTRNRIRKLTAPIPRP